MGERNDLAVWVGVSTMVYVQSASGGGMHFATLTALGHSP